MQPFNISTPDGEVLYAWHILPLQRYVEHEGSAAGDIGGITGTATQLDALNILTAEKDPKALLVINCEFDSKG